MLQPYHQRMNLPVGHPNTAIWPPGRKKKKRMRSRAEDGREEIMESQSYVHSEFRKQETPLFLKSSRSLSLVIDLQKIDKPQFAGPSPLFFAQ